MPLSVPRPRFRPDIEGLRALAILLVVGYHAGVPGFSGGYVGVDVFFVLSGYLITWLLVHEVETTGALDFFEFYARRARRLLPAVAALLVVITGASAVLYSPLEQLRVAKTAVATAAYLSNVYFAKGAMDYFGAVNETNPLLHTWSLSVEEQFYLVWPLLVFLAHRARGGFSPRRLLGWMTVVAVLSFGLSVYVTATAQPLAFFHSPLRAWEFAAGALGLLLPRLKREGSWTGLGGLALVLAAAISFSEETSFPGVAALLPVSGTVLILRTEGAGRLGRVLGWRPFQEAGRLSYSWYLWHWPVLVLGASVLPAPSLAVRLALVALSLGLAEASYRWVEDPIRHSAFLARRARRSLAMGGVLTACGVLLGLGWLAAATQWTQIPAQRPYAQIRDDNPAIARNGCHAGFEPTTARFLDCAVGPDTARTVVLFGDSHAGQWYPVLEDIAETRGWRLIPATKASCPAADAAIHLSTLRRTYHECEAWRDDVFEKIAALRPDLVIAVSENDQPWGPAEWEAGTQRTADALAATSDRVVFLRDTPHPGFDVPACVARAAWRLRGVPVSACTVRDVDASDGAAYAAERAAAARYPNVESVDLNGLICPGGACAAERDGMLVYRDDHHLTATFVRTLYDYVTAVIDPAGEAGAPAQTVAQD